MPCSICGAADHDSSVCPQRVDPPAADPPKPTAADNLLTLLDQAANRAATATREAIETTTRTRAPDPPPAAAPAAPAAPDPGDDLAQKAEELINKGHAAEAIKLIKDATFGPQSAAIASLSAGVARGNVNELKRTYGDKFTKREELFNATVRKYNAENALADPKVVEQLWNITLVNDPTYMEEEVQSRLTAADEERRQQIANAPPPLSPLEESLALPDTYKELAKKHLDEDQEERAWQIQQIHAYGLTTEQFLRQADKAGDPESTYGIGVGKWRCDIWTKIGGKSRPTPPTPPIAT